MVTGTGSCTTSLVIQAESGWLEDYETIGGKVLVFSSCSEGYLRF